MFILIGGITCHDEIKSTLNTIIQVVLNRKTAFGNTLCDHIYINFFSNIQYFSIIENIAFNTDFNIAIQLN